MGLFSTALPPVAAAAAPAPVVVPAPAAAAAASVAAVGNLFACSTDAITLAPSVQTLLLDRCDATLATTIPAGAAAAAAAASIVASVPTVACPAPRPTLASTAALFIPDKHSPILLAPSESEIQSDPTYYRFGAQLVAALVLFSVAYFLAHVILGAVRRRERRAKAALKAALRKEAGDDDATALTQQQQQQQRRRHARNDSRSSSFQSSLSGSGGGPGPGVVRPRLYVIQPAAPPLHLIRSSVSLELSDLTPVPTRLQRLQRRISTSIQWILGWPARWRRRRRAKAKQAEQLLQHQLHRARRASVTESGSGFHASAAPPSSSAASTPISKARRMSTTIAAFLKLRAGAHASAASGLAHGSGAAASGSPDASDAPSAEQIERDAAFATSQLLASFSTPLPWLSPELPDALSSSSSASKLSLPPQQQPSSFRNRAASISSISDTISSWTAAAFSHGGGGGGAGSATPNASPVSASLRASPPVPLSLLSPRQHSRDGPSSAAASSSSSSSSSLSLMPLPSPSRSSSPSPDSFDSDQGSPRSRDRDGHSSSSSSSLLLGGGAHDEFPEEENEREFLTYSLSTFVVCVALVWLELLVLSVLASGTGSAPSAAAAAINQVGGGGGITSLNQLYLFSWCTKDLVTVLWTVTVWLSSVSLFVLAPFAFLYFEAEGILGRRGTLSRVAETVCVLTAFTIALYGSFHLLHAIIGMDVTASAGNISSSNEPVTLISHSFWTDLWGSSSSNAHGTWGSWSWALSWAGGLNLESLYSNIWHFLPGLLMLLLTCHNGFIELIALAYRGAAAVDLPSPLAAQDLKLTQRLNAIKCEMATLQRKWTEMHDETLLRRQQQLQSQQQAQRQARAESFRARSAGFSGRAIAPASYNYASSAYAVSAQPSSAALSLHAKKLLLARLEQLHIWHAECSRELRPLSWKARIQASPYVRNSGWLLLTVCALLFTWHIILRVAQREARLIFRGSIFRWFRDPVFWFETAAHAQDPSAQSSWAVLRALWWTLATLKSTLGTVLSLLTGKVLGNKNAATSSIAALAPLTPVSVAPTVAAAPLFDSPWLSALVDLFRVLCSVLLGINGFQHPGVAFLADVGVIAFFLLASARHVYSAPGLARFSPLAALQAQVERAQKAKKRRAAGSGGGVGEGDADQEEEDASVAASSDSAALLFSAQFFTVNAVIFLLLASSLPIATWMLGLSSFDLFEFYPQSAAQLAASDVRSLHPPVVGGGSFFLHLYNLTFLALTGWHVTQISKQIVVWVLFEQVLGTVEVVVERARIKLGYAKPNAPPSDRFVMFGAWRRSRSMPGQPEMTRMQALVYVLRQFWFAARFLLAPLVRWSWFLAKRASRVLLWMGRHAWEAVTAFLLSELSDDDDLREAAAGRARSASPPMVMSSPSPIPAIAESPIDAHPMHARAESTLTTQMLAEVDAASVVGQHEKDGAVPFTLSLPPGPSPLRPVHRRSFARNGGSTLGLTTSGSFALFARSLSAPGASLHGHSFSEVDSEADLDTPSSEAFGRDSASATPQNDASAVDVAAATGPAEDEVGSPLYRSRTATRSSTVFHTPGLVPSFSRKLSLSMDPNGSDPRSRISVGLDELKISEEEAGSSPVSDSSEGGHSPMALSMQHSASAGRMLSDRDFPLMFTPQQLRSIDEDGRSIIGAGDGGRDEDDDSAAPSDASSAAPTPHMSPLFTPHPHPHRASSSPDFDALSLEPLSASAAGESPLSDWTPTPSSHGSSAASTPVSSSSLGRRGVDDRLRSHPSLRSAVMRLEPTLEESSRDGHDHALDDSAVNSSGDSDSSMHGQTAAVAAQIAAAAVTGGLASQSTSSDSDDADSAD